MLKFVGTLFFLISYLISAQNLTPVFHSRNAEVNRLTDLALQQMKKDENNLNALNTALKAKRKAIDDDDNLAIAKANATMGWIFLDGNNLDAAKNFVEKAFKNVEKEKNAEADAMLHHQLAIILDKKAMPKEALRHYLKSIDFYEKNRNYLKLLQVYSEISRLYLTTGNMESFRKYFLMTEDLLKKHPNNHMQLVFNNQKNYVLMSEKKYEEAYTLNMQSANLAHRSGIKNKAATALYNAAGALFEMNKIEEAERLVEKGIAYAKKNNLDYSDFMIGKAQIYMERGEPENVEQLYRDAINHYVKTKNVFMEMQSRKLLTDFYRKNHQSEKASEEYFSFKKLEDSLASAKQAIALKEVEYQYKDLEKEELIKSYKTSSVLKNWLIAAVASLALGIIYLFFNLRKNAALRQTLFEKKEKLLEAEKKNAIAEKIMAKKEEEKALLNEKLLLEEQKILKMEKENTDRELASITLYVQEKNRMIENLQTKMDDLLQKSSAENRDKLLDISRNLKNSISFEKDWDKIKLHFEKVHPQFFSILSGQFPNLTPNELKHCAYIKMNMSNKETANLLGVDHNSVKMSRYRIKKKIGLSQEEDLTAYIQSIF